MTGGKPKRRARLEELKPLLDQTGMEWRIEEGSRHHKVFLAGRMILVLPRTFSEGRGSPDLAVQVRRAAARISAGGF
jgi:hypothetical protein